MTQIRELDFSKIKKAVAAQWNALQKFGDLFVVDEQNEDPEQTLRHKIWATYLAAFPEGTDPMFRTRTQHDCSCCRGFIRNAGRVVAIAPTGSVVSLWDIETGDEAYDQVCRALSAYVKSLPIAEPFRTAERKFGVDKTFGDYIDGKNETWNHFVVHVDPDHQVPHGEVPSVLGKLRTKHQVLLRALRELEVGAIDTVLELISQNSLYRGEEFKRKLLSFQEVQNKFDMVPSDQEENFVWQQLAGTHDPVAEIRNSAIGTLLVNLSEGMDLEQAVRSYESVVAPANYRRPTSLITQSMIDSARKKVEDLGLLGALDRRLAEMEDIKVTNILFADRASRKIINPDAFHALTPSKASKHNLSRTEEITIEKFVTDVLPNIESMEILFENSKAGNLMTLVAPTDPTAGQLFSWKNGFSWAYAGDMADSIKERVKKAGGNVTGDVCCRLAWYNHDDLDLHMETPGVHIYYGCKVDPRNGGELDVDMNAGHGTTREPVENIFFRSIRTMTNGNYLLYVNQYMSRERANEGFEVEIDVLGEVSTFAYNKPLRTDDQVNIATLLVRDGKVTVQPILESTPRTREVWGMKTGEFHPVNLLMLSPNHWEGERGIGNKHWFFITEGASNPDNTRGFFNEYLDSRLNEHRKVFEVLGSQMKTGRGGPQLSGFGFSSTKKDSVVVNVRGTINRQLKINF